MGTEVETGGCLYRYAQYQFINVIIIQCGTESDSFPLELNPVLNTSHNEESIDYKLIYINLTMMIKNYSFCIFGIIVENFGHC